jgi:tight adherence protein B
MNSIWLRALALVLIFAAVVLASEVLVRWFAANRTESKAIKGRLTFIGQGRNSNRTNALRREVSSIPAGLPEPFHGMAEALERMLFQAHLAIEIPRLMLLLVLAPMIIFFGFLMLMAMYWGVGISFGRIVLTATFSLVLGMVFPLMAINWKATRNRKKIEEQFPVALDVFVRGLRAGHPIAAALDLLTVEMPPPIGPEFALVVDEVTYGAELRDALQNMADRWDHDDMRMFVVSLSVQNETGGNLAEILENLSKVIRERHAMFLKVRALSSEGRMTAIMLTVLPILTFVSMVFLNPRFFLDVANDPMFVPGFAILGVLYVVGYLIIRRMVDLKV